MYRREVFVPASWPSAGVLALGPVFVASALAAFAGEHFTIAKSLAAMVPKFMPARLFIAYFVGVAHLCAALSLVARRCVRWSTLLLGIMFALFVLLLHFPGALRNPGVRIAWIVTVRETTFSLGALSFFATVIRDRSPRPATVIAQVARVWSALVLIYYGIDQLFHPQYSPGVPDTKPTSQWGLVYATGGLLIAFGIMMLVRKYAVTGAKKTGLLMLLLTAILYLPQSFLAHGVSDQINALNFVFDTLLFSGTMLAIARAIAVTEAPADAAARAAG